MKPEEQRVAIAEACEWIFDHVRNDAMYYLPEKDFHVGDPLRDLNAMHEAEEIIKIIEGGWGAYCGYLVKGDSWFEVVHATAAQRAEAFLRTIGKWTTNPNEKL
jgi:hypothetical protein